MTERTRNSKVEEEAQRLIREAVESCIDPLTNKRLVELGIVNSVDVQMGTSTVEMSLPVAPSHYPNLVELKSVLEDALKAVGIVNEVNFDITQMSQGEQDNYLLALGHQIGVEKKPPISSNTRILAISSGKGGVGKSSLSVNLAVALAKRGSRVALLDADIYGFSISQMLDSEAEPLVIGNLIVPPRAFGITFISAGLFANADQPVIWRGPMLHGAISQFLNNVAWLDPEYLVIDMPPGTGDVALSVSELLPEAEFYVVTTPQLAAEQVAQRSALAARTLKAPVRGVIENMSYFRGDDGKKYEIFGHGGGESLATSLGVKLIGQIPILMNVREGGDSGIPVVVSDPEGEAAQAYLAIADKISSLGQARRRRESLKIN